MAVVYTVCRCTVSCRSEQHAIPASTVQIAISTKVIKTVYTVSFITLLIKMKYFLKLFILLRLLLPFF